MANIIQMFEQFQTSVENQAVVVATYYKKLIQEGVPPDLAAQLTQQFNILWWNKIGASPNEETPAS